MDTRGQAVGPPKSAWKHFHVSTFETWEIGTLMGFTLENALQPLTFHPILEG